MSSSPTESRDKSVPDNRRRPSAVVLGIVTVILCAGGGWFMRWWLHQQAYVTTDDARVATDLITVSPRIAGNVSTLLVDEGQLVRVGQVVGRLDEADFQAELSQAQAALGVALSNLAAARDGVSLQDAQNEATIAQAGANAQIAAANLARARVDARRLKNDHVRIQRLHQGGAASERELDVARNAWQAAEATVTACMSQLQSAREGDRLARTGLKQAVLKRDAVATTEAQVIQAQAAVDAAKLRLSHATVVSPIDGVVARRMVNLGERVQMGQGLLAIARTSRTWVLANIQETNIRRIAPGARVDIHIDAYPKRAFRGTVATINAVTGAHFSLFPQNNAAGNFTKVVQRIPVKITVADPEHLLKPGMSAVIEIETGQAVLSAPPADRAS